MIASSVTATDIVVPDEVLSGFRAWGLRAEIRWLQWWINKCLGKETNKQQTKEKFKIYSEVQG